MNELNLGNKSFLVYILNKFVDLFCVGVVDCCSSVITLLFNSMKPGEYIGWGNNVAWLYQAIT